MLKRIIQLDSELSGIYSIPGHFAEKSALAQAYSYPGDTRECLHVTLRDPRGGQNINQIMKWGFIPYWVKQPSRWDYEKDLTWEGVRNHYKYYDIPGKPTFDQPWRCLVPAASLILSAENTIDETNPARNIAEYKLGMVDGKAFALAGVWEGFHHPQTGHLYPLGNFGVLTFPANSSVGAYDGRIPAIIARENYERWLSGIDRDPQDLAALLSSQEIVFQPA